MSTAKSTVAPVTDPAAALARLVDEFGPAAVQKLDDIAKAFKVAEGVQKVRAIVLQAAPQILPLQGSALGFRTDKDKDGGYPPAVVAECATEALLRGLRLTGNEWNIIGGRCYVAQAGLARLVAELPGLTDLELAPAVPVMKEGGAIVEYAAQWKLGPTAMALKRSIPVRVNNGMGADAILGKAKRKMLAAIHERVTGSTISDGEVDDAPLLPAAAPKSSQLVERAAEKRAAGREPHPLPGARGDVERDPDGNPIFPAADGTLFPDPRSGNLPD